MKMVIEMQKRLTKRYIIKSLEGLDLSNPIRYERYYLNDTLRIQKKENQYQKEILSENNVLVSKEEISIEEFNQLKKQAYKKIIRDSYLYLKDPRISIKQYDEDYEGLNRVEVSFKSEEELENFQKEAWMGKEITNSPLAFDKYLSKLTKQEFLSERTKYLGE